MDMCSLHVTQHTHTTPLRALNLNNTHPADALSDVRAETSSYCVQYAYRASTVSEQIEETICEPCESEALLT